MKSSGSAGRQVIFRYNGRMEAVEVLYRILRLYTEEPEGKEAKKVAGPEAARGCDDNA